MNNNVLFILIWSLILIVYLTLLPSKRLKDFGIFLKTVMSVLPITKVVEAIGILKSKNKN